MATGKFQTELNPIFKSDSTQQVTLKMETMISSSVLVKKNNDDIDNVVLAEGSLAANTVEGKGDVPNTREIKINLLPGDTISAQAQFADTVSYTVIQE